MVQPEARNRLASVEVMRGVAACLVVFYHAARHIAKNTGEMPFGTASQFGHAGVDFFFVLSGFIILHVHADDIGTPSRARRYLWRRATRIFPIYWAMLALTLGIAAFFGRHGLPATGRIFTDLFLFPTDWPILGVAWTLHYEMVFYANFLVIILHRRLGIALFFLWAVLILARLADVLPHHLPAAIALYVSFYSAQFFFGMAAAWLVRREDVNRPEIWLALGAVGFLIAGLCENANWLNGYQDLARVIYGGTATIILVGLVGMDRAGRVRLPALAVAIGSASYAIYLTHVLLVGLTWKLLAVLGWLAILPGEVTYIIMVFTGIAGGIVVSKWVELPLMQWCRRWTRNTSGPRELGASGQAGR